MAQTGYTPISIYYSSTATNVPTAGNLVAGELAINTADGKLFYKDSSGVVQVIASKSTGTAGGSNTQVQYNSSGALAGSANFVFDGNNASLGTSTLNPLSNGGTNKTFAVSGGSGFGSVSLVTSATADGSIVGALNFGSSGASSNPTTAAINTYLSGSGATNASGYMSFFTRNGTDLSERMRIDSSGNVQIGTSTSLITGLTTAISTNGGMGVSVKNVNTGTGTYSYYQLGNANATNRAGIALTGSAWTASGLIQQDGLYMQCGGGGGITIATETTTPIYFGTNNAERMRITSAGLVGIGTNNPSEQLTVSNGCVLVTGGLSALRASSLSLDFQSSQGRFIATGADASTYATVILGSATTTTYQERMRLNTNGNLVLQGGSTGASGIGVTFPATQSASSDANCLDDYEEGTFTPVMSGALVYSMQVGRYTKIGNAVTFVISVNATRTASSTGFTISGLPFTSANVSSLYTTFVVFPVFGLNRSTATSYVGQNIPNSSSINIYGYLTSSSQNYLSMTMNDTGTTVELEISGTYYTS